MIWYMKNLWLCQNVSDDKNDKLSEKILSGLETIDDETDSSDMLLVKVSEIEEAREEFGESVIGNDLPSLVFFDDKVPTKFDGRLRNLHISRYNYFWNILLPLYWLYNILDNNFLYYHRGSARRSWCTWLVKSRGKRSRPTKRGSESW